VENFDPKLSDSDLRDFFLQFQVLLDAGVPVTRALTSISESGQTKLSQVAEGLALELEKGRYLSSAMDEYPDSFDTLTRTTIRIGEKSGRLALIMSRLSSSYEWRMTVRKQLIEALLYPVCIVVMALAMVCFMSHYMLPRILPLLTSLGVPLPLPTRVLLFFVEQQWLFLLPAGFLLILLVDSTWGKGHREARAVHWVVYASPLLGRINRTRALSQLCSDLAMLAEVGLSFLDGVKALAGAVSDQRLGKALDSVYRKVLSGMEVEEALEAQPYLTPLVQNAVATGLETGGLAESLRAAAAILDLEAEAATQHLLKMLEPLALAILGGLVGGILVACFLPLYSLMAKGL